METLPIIVIAFWLILGALIVLEEHERTPAARYKAPAASMAPPRSRGLISATTLAGMMAGLSLAMTSAAQ